MKFVKYAVPVLVILSTGVEASAFQNLYQVGKDNNLLLKAQDALQESNKQQQNLALAGLLPRVTLLGNWNYRQEKNDIRSQNYLQTLPQMNSQADGLGYEVSLTQPLFNLPAYHNYQRGVAVSALAELQKSQAEVDYIQEFSRTYLQIIGAAQQIANINTTINAYEAQQQLIVKQYQSGLAKPSDIQQAQASLATLKSEAILVKNNQTVAFKNLELLLQSEVNGVPSWIDELEQQLSVANSLASYVAKFNHNVDYKVAKANVKIAEKQMKIDSSLSLPSVTASVRYSDNHFDNSFDFQAGNTLYRDGLSVAVQLRVPLYAGSGDRYQKQAATYNYQSVKYQKQFIEHQTQQAIRTTYLNFQAGLAAIQARKESVAASQAALANANTEYRSGIGQYTEVRDSQQRLYQQTNRLITDKTNLLNDYFTLARLVGQEPDITVKTIEKIFTGEVIHNES